MARLVTWGFETNATMDSGARPDGQFVGTSPPTVSSAVSRSGAYSAKCDSGAGFSSYVRRGTTGDVAFTASATNYARMYFRFDALPASTINVMQAGSAQINVKLTAAGKLQLWRTTLSQIGSDSVATIAADASTWYRLELAVTLNATPQITGCELLLDGVSVASTTGLTLTIAVIDQWSFGWLASPGASRVCYLDDAAVNDSTGGSQNSWPGPGNVVLLRPTADSAGGAGWTLGTGTALGGNGYLAVDNTPPVGVADLTAGSDTKQIRNATANANTNYDATLTTYTAAGVPSGATVNVVDPIIETGAPSATGAKAGTVGVVSNPAITNVALGSVGTAGAFWQGNAAGAYPSGSTGLGWKWSHGTITYTPSVTLGTAPVMRVTQVTSSTRIAMVCFMGVYVEYIPAAGSTTWNSSAAVALTDSRVTAGTRTTATTTTLALANVRVTAGVRKTFSAAAVPLTAALTANGVVSTGGATHLGVAAVALTNQRTTAGTRRTTSTSAVALTNTRVTAGTRRTTSSATVALSNVRTTAGTRRTTSSAAVSLTNTRVTSGTRRTFGVISLGELLTVTTAGTVSTGPTTRFGAAAVALTNVRVTVGIRKTFGVVARGETLFITTAGARVKYGATAVPLHVTTTTSGRRAAVTTVLVHLHALLYTNAGTVTPLPAGRIDTITLGGIPRIVFRGIDRTNPGGITRPQSGRLARSSH